MNITRDNYENFVIDFLEGNLSEKERVCFELFLSENEDIKKEIEQLNDIKLIGEEVIFDDKLNLKKSELSNELDCSYFEELCIKKTEKEELTIEQHNDFNNFLKKDKKNKSTFNKISKTRLVPNLNIIYNNKNELKHYSITGKKAIYTFMSVAASVIFIFFAFNIFYNNDKNFQADLMKNDISHNSNHRSVIETFTKENNFNSPINTNSENKQDEIVKTIQNEDDVLIADVIQIIEYFSVESVENITEIQLINESSENFEKQIAFNAKSTSNLTIFDKYFLTKDLIKNTIEDKIITPDEIELNGLNIAETAIKGYNNLTESDIKLEKIFDETGNLVAIDFSSSKFDFFTNKIGR